LLPLTASHYLSGAFGAGGDEFLEARIVAQIVPIGVDSQQRGRHRRGTIGNVEQVLKRCDRVVLVAKMRLDPR
jgi:hypothetical protein